jgi:hypothetical protein
MKPLFVYIPQLGAVSVCLKQVELNVCVIFVLLKMYAIFLCSWFCGRSRLQEPVHPPIQDFPKVQDTSEGGENFRGRNQNRVSNFDCMKRLVKDSCFYNCRLYIIFTPSKMLSS